MNVLITGGAGYLGGVVTKMLCENIDKVTVVDTFRHRNYGIRSLMSDAHLRVLKENAFDTNLTPYDCIINLAAIAGETACIGIDHEEVLRNNYQLPVHISDNLRSDQFMVQASTTAVYGDLDGNNIDGVEMKVSSALGRYASSKLMADVLLMGLPNVAVVRIPTLYGISPVMRKNILIHDMCEQAIEEGAVLVYGDVDSVRPIGHVDAVAEELISIIRHREDGLHLLAAENMSKKLMALQIADSAGCKVLRAPGRDLIKQDHYMEPPSLTGRLKDHVGRIIDSYRIMM